MASISSLGVGSGLDLNGLLDQLRDAERSKLEPIKIQQQQQQAKISAYGQLQTALNSFQDSVAKLNDGDLFKSLSSSVKGEGLTAKAADGASPGRFEVEIERVARAGSLATSAADTRDEELFASAATLTLDFGATYDADGNFDDAAAALSSVPIEIAAGSSLEDVRDAINANEEAGVTASIVNDGSGYRLALSSKETGAEASLVGLKFEDKADPLAAVPLTEDTATLRPGQDAAINVNGIAITSPTNTIEGAIEGVTLTLDSDAEAGSTLSVAVEQDTLKVREAITGFVKAFNDLKGTIGKLTAYDAKSGKAGELIGDNTVRTIESRMRSVLGGGVAEGDLRMLSDVGISLQRDGTLELDSDTLDDLVKNDMAALGEFFAGADEAGGLAGKLDETLGQLLGDSGIVNRSIEGAKSRGESLIERHTRMEKSIERTIERYRVQFGQLDAMIAQMNQTSDYLTQQFDALDAQLGRKK